jgi:hypothetical protein
MSIMSALRAAITPDASSYGLPGKEWFDNEMRRAAKTPDAFDLIGKEFVRLFVYDLETEGDESKLLQEQGCEFGQGFTRRKFTMLKRRLGKLSHPIPLEKEFIGGTGKHDYPFLPIRGRVMVVQPEVIFALDNYRENGMLFIRKRMDITIPVRKVLRRKLEDPRGGLSQRGKRIVQMTGIICENMHCYMYVGMPGAWMSGHKGKLIPPISAFDYKAVQTFPFNESPNMKFREFYMWRRQELYGK